MTILRSCTKLSMFPLMNSKHSNNGINSEKCVKGDLFDIDHRIFSKSSILIIASFFGARKHKFPRELVHHFLSYWSVTCSAPSHYLHQWRCIVNYNVWNTLQRYYIKICKVQEHTLGNAVYKISAILLRIQYINVFPVEDDAKCFKNFNKE